MSKAGDFIIFCRLAIVYGRRYGARHASGVTLCLSFSCGVACASSPSIPAVPATLDGAVAAAGQRNAEVLASYLIDDRGQALSAEATEELREVMGPELTTRIKRAARQTSKATTRYTFRLNSSQEATVLVRSDSTNVDVQPTTGTCHSTVRHAIQAVHDELKAQLEADLHSPGTLAARFSSRAVEDWRQDAARLVEGLSSADELDPVLAGDSATVTLGSDRVLSFVKQFDCWKLEYVK